MKVEWHPLESGKMNGGVFYDDTDVSVGLFTCHQDKWDYFKKQFKDDVVWVKVEL